jgi:hypothetical protein
MNRKAREKNSFLEICAVKPYINTESAQLFAAEG